MNACPRANLIRPETIRAFTLVEMLVATSVLTIILLFIFKIVSLTGNLWTNTSSKITTFQNARAAFDAVTRNLSQATLNHYYDYYDASWERTSVSSTSNPPVHYGRYSELEFVSGPVETLFPSAAGEKVSHGVFFQAPLGKTNRSDLLMESPGMMNELGYFVEYCERSRYDQIPQFLQGSTGADVPGFRLVEWIQPAEKLDIYDTNRMKADPWAWFKTPVSTGENCRVMADNIVALIVLPKKDTDNLSLSTKYFYDSTTTDYEVERSYLLPPLLQVTLVAIDEASALRLRERNGDTQPAIIPAGAFVNIQDYDQELKNLTDLLNGSNGGARLNYRVFTTTVSTKEGK